MIGSLEDARLIYSRRKSGRGAMPKGWKKVGEGVYRTAYLSPDGVVYKICNDKDQSNNDREYQTYLNIRKSKTKYKGWKVNPVHSYNFMYGHDKVVVNASPFVEGKHELVDWGSTDYDKISREEEKINQAFQAFGILDGHDKNYIVSKRGRVIIDLGGYQEVE